MYEFTGVLEWDGRSLDDAEASYERGFVFTRLKKGLMHQIRSCRVDLNRFELSSENRRILNKLPLEVSLIPLPYENYHWEIAKMGLDFYTSKFRPNIMSANKLREMFTDPDRSNMNSVFVYRPPKESRVIGYCLSFATRSMLHYSYPFYDLSLGQNYGMAMMLCAVHYTKKNNIQYIYLGTAKRYKMQFKGIEVFDGVKWIDNREQIHDKD